MFGSNLEFLYPFVRFLCYFYAPDVVLMLQRIARFLVLSTFVPCFGILGRNKLGVKESFWRQFLNLIVSLTSRHVVLPKELVRLVPKTHLMSESEWRAIGVQQSRGWVHYMIHQPEPHILLFRRPKTETA